MSSKSVQEVCDDITELSKQDREQHVMYQTNVTQEDVTLHFFSNSNKSKMQIQFEIQEPLFDTSVAMTRETLPAEFEEIESEIITHIQDKYGYFPYEPVIYKLESQNTVKVADSFELM